MRSIIAVCGSGGLHCDPSDSFLALAEEVGMQIASKGAVLVCGGLGGVMEAACRGAKKKQGCTLGILPGDAEEGNEFLDMCIPTNLGHMRNYLVVRTGEAVIAIGGRYGTLSELSYALILGRPLVLLKGTGGVVDFLLASGFFEEFGGEVQVASSAVEAVELALTYCSES